MRTILQSSITIETTSYEDGKIYSRKFLAAGKLHREPADGAACEYFGDHGKVSCQQFCTNGKLHRPIADGAAWKRFDNKGKVLSSRYYLNGNFLSDAEVESILGYSIKRLASTCEAA